MKKLVIISASILILITCIAFIAGVTAVTDTTSVDPASLSLSLFKKNTDTTPTTTITGNAVDDSGNTIATVTIKAGEEVGRVRDDFYGVNTQSSWLRKEKYIDLNSDGINEAYSDLNWHRKTFLESGLKYIREEAKIEECYWVNSSNLSHFKRKCDFTSILEEYEWAKQNGVRILNILSYMPVGLRNLSASCSSNPLVCEPLDYDVWGKILVDYINATTLNGHYLDIIDYEIWNEPDLSRFLLPDLEEYGTQEAASIYVKLYNASYININLIYPEAKIIGPSSAHIDVYTNITFSFLNNFSEKMDGISAHNYYPADKNSVITRIKNTLNYCKIYHTNCSRLIISEYNYKNISGIGGGVELSNVKMSNYYADIFVDGLNLYPSSISLIIYQWGETRKYLPNVNYPEYPSRWSMVSEPGLDNVGPTYYPSYNVTKDFAHYHAGGNMIVNSSSSYNAVKSVASLNPQNIWHITVINTATSNISVNVDVSSTGVEALKDLATGIVYPVSNGIANVGVLTEYDVKHYEGIENYEIPEEESITSISSSSVGKNKLVSVENLNINTNEFAAIHTDTSKVISTSDIFVNTNTNTNSGKNNEEKEEFYGPIQSEEDIMEIDYKSRTGSLSLAVSNKSYLMLLIILLGSIICTSLIISIIYRKKKREADKVQKLMDWVDKARSLGYSNEKMKQILAEYNWDKDLVEKVLGK